MKDRGVSTRTVSWNRLPLKRLEPFGVQTIMRLRYGRWR